ncbi:MAG TPA: hypothetical protein ENK61_03335 [Devosia sp.]|nr:hypothetical protein [Devosia sp.]
MGGFKLSKSDFAQIAASELVGSQIGLPLVGSAAALAVRFGNMVLSETFEIKQAGHSKYGKYLIEDIFYLRQKYNNEKWIHRNLPYVELVSFVGRARSAKDYKLLISAENKLFRCSPFEDDIIERIRDTAFAKFSDDRRITHDSTIIRLSSVADKGTETELKIQRTKYSEQARSNLILDFKVEAGSVMSMREHLLGEFTRTLPPLTDERLANTLGVAILVFYRDGENLVPFFVPRTKEPAVFNYGEWHCTASGAAEWPDDFEGTSKTFEAFILDDLYTELREEVGLMPEDVTNVLPLSICRELVRGGKPQLFFIGFTELEFDELVVRMERARDVVLPRSEPTEVFKMPLFRFPRSMKSVEELTSEFESGGFTSEGATSLFYALQFLEGAIADRLNV